MYKAKKAYAKSLALLLALFLLLCGFPVAASAVNPVDVASGGGSYEFPYSLTGTATSGFGSHNIKLYDPGTGTYYQAFCGNSNKATPYGVSYTRNRILDPNDPVDGQKNRVILRALYYGYGGKGYAGYNTTKWAIQWAETRANYSVDKNFFKLCGINTDTYPYRYYTDAEIKKIKVTINKKFNSNNVASDITPITVTPILNGDELKITPSKTTLSSSYKHIKTATENYWRQESESIKLTGNGTAEITVPNGYSFVYNGKTYGAGTHTVNAGYSGYVWCSANNKGTATITGNYTKDTFSGAVYRAGSSYQPLISRVIVPQTETAQFSFSASFDGGIELQLQKTSANPDMTDGNSCYSFEGAEFNVYSDLAKANAAKTKDTAEAKDDGRIGMIVTDKNGKGTLTDNGSAKLMPIGTYYAVERKAPTGYKCSEEVYTFTDTNTTDMGIPVYKAGLRGKQEIPEEPYNDPMFIEISKTDENGNLIKALEATFEVKYYDGYYTDESQLIGKTPTATWLFKTINGRVAYDKLHIVSGSDLYFRDALQTEPAIPLGTITIQEKDSPPGYARDDTLRIRQIQRKSETGTVEEDYTFTMEIPNVPVSISTSASVNSVFESTASTVTDTVFYSGLEPNTNYTVTGWLVKKSSGAVVPLTGSDGTTSNNKVTKSFTTTADGNGSVQIKYNFDSRGYGGETVVAFAEVRNSDGTVIGGHKDIDSKDQSIQFKPPGIATSAISSNSNSRYIYPFDDVKITDTISFQNLISDTYTITPKAMLISKDGKSVEKEIPVSIDSENVKALSGNGSVDVEFTIGYEEFEKLVGNDESRLNELNGRTIVIYETLSGANGNNFTHEDMNDIAQSLTMITPTVATKATDSVTRQHQTYASENTVINDEVTIDGLVPGEKYEIDGYVFADTNGSPIAFKVQKFTATSKSQSFTMSYTVNSTNYAGKALFCSAYVYAPDGLTQIAIHSGANDAAQQVEFLSPTISTTANAPSTGSRYAYATDYLQIDDTVNLTGLITGLNYELRGQIVEKATGNVIANSSTPIFAKNETQSETMTLTFDASDYAGSDVVVFESLYYGGKLVAEHTNINDTAQTVTLLNPTISTKARGNTSVSDNSEIRDSVTITGLIPGKEYTIVGQVTDKATVTQIELISAKSGTNEIVLSEDKMTATVRFAATAETQTISITYTFNNRPYAGKEVVVFETLFYKGDVIATHTDINDTDQTIKYKDEGDLKLRKYDNYTGDNLQRAVFNLYRIDEDGSETLMSNCFTSPNSAGIGEYYYSSDASGKTDLNPFYYIPGFAVSEESLGTMTVKQLPSGTYVLKEKKAPSGYMIDIADGVTFEVTSGETTELAVGNSPALVSLELIKTDDTDAANRVAGVGFTLYSNEACTTKAKDFYGTEISEVITDSSGAVAFERIKYSLTAQTSYYLKETTTPPGYAPLDYIIRVHIDTDGKVSYFKLTNGGESPITDTVTRPSEGGDFTVTRIINKRLGSITVYKKSATDKTPLEGVVMSLSDSDGNTLRFSKDASGEYVLDANGQTDIVTDKDGKAVMSGLLYGTYYVSEIKTLSNYYLLAEDVDIQLDRENVSQEIFNTPKASFPTAGSFDKMLWLLIGGAVAACGLILFIITTKKKRKEKSKMTKLKRYSKNFLTILIVALTLVSMFCVGAGAANPYHIDMTKTGSIEFWKYEMEDDAINNATTPGDGELKTLPEGATPLEGVEFTIYQIYTKSQLADFFKEDGRELPTPTEAETMVTSVPANRVQKNTTDSNGYIKFDNLELGIYYVKETFSPSQVRQQTAPFVVAVPSTNAAGTDWLYDLTVQPKNQTKYTSVTLRKTAVSTDTAKNGKDLAGFTFLLEEKITTINSATGVTTDTWTPVATTGSVGTTGGSDPTAATWTTGANGKFTIDHLATAREYRFKELSATDKQYIVDSTVYYYFRTNADGTINYAGRVTPGDTITYPTATVADNTIGVTNETPEVHKYVSVDTTDVSEKTWHQDVTQDINKTVYWKVAADIPEIIEKLSTYKIIDTLSKGLTYDSSANNKDTQVYVEIDGAAISKNDYTVTSAKNSTTGETVITVNVTNMSVLAGHTTCNVIFTTTLNEDAVIGGDNPNEARLEYTNDVGTDSTYYKDTEEPEVHTGGYTWYKKSSDMNAPLANAKFKVYRSEADAKSNTNAIEFAKGADGKYYMVNDGEGDAVVVSGADGYVTVLGLLYGSDDLKSNEGSTDYWVSEIEAPKGYNLLQAPFKITVTATSHNYASNANVDVVNTPEAEFPLTGGQAAMLFGIGGAAVIGIGAIVFLKKRKNDDSKCGEK